MTASDQEYPRSRSKRHAHHHNESSEGARLPEHSVTSIILTPSKTFRGFQARAVDNFQTGAPEEDISEPRSLKLETQIEKVATTLNDSLVTPTLSADTTTPPSLYSNGTCIGNCTLLSISINTTQALNTSYLLFNGSRISYATTQSPVTSTIELQATTLSSALPLPPVPPAAKQLPPSSSLGTPSSNSPSDTGSGGGLTPVNQKVVGGVVGCLAGSALILIALLYLLRRRRHQISLHQQDRSSSLASLTPHSKFLASLLHRNSTPEHLTTSPPSPEFVVISGRRTSSEQDLQYSDRRSGDSPTSIYPPGRLGSTATHFRNSDRPCPISELPSITVPPLQDPVGRSLAVHDGSSISRFREHEEDL
ncbi:hypothetical protein NEOLI_001986 [Neolecta irregularis DAH-3]|uniref:Carcinoembryonic antigen-related cell adhesion molecule 1 n=1 Tax=Neolecta irregularis (strain DAH-3) TaxID=1198029 RepID=A0A1U7LWQ7_NEOID|nr:hypothetical protein NEOLI_001986 [Neolecta irregularis DAH-3]|eukprot:OLL26982.1 hypothetical protein NEOLI_001986 [Neolecta irregularis DAH-3]